MVSAGLLVRSARLWGQDLVARVGTLAYKAVRSDSASRRTRARADSARSAKTKRSIEVLRRVHVVEHAKPARGIAACPRTRVERNEQCATQAAAAPLRVHEHPLHFPGVCGVWAKRNASNALTLRDGEPDATARRRVGSGHARSVA